MNPVQEAQIKKIDSKELKDSNKKNSVSPKSVNMKNSASPKDLKKTISLPNEKEMNSDFGLSFKEIYDYHIKEIEAKTNIKIKHIYTFLFVAFIFFMIGHFERIFSYIITGYFPIIWTREDYKAKKDYFWKKWGTYWTIFAILIFFDLHKKEVLKFIPLYFVVRCIFLLMLYLPGFTIAVSIYDGFLKHFIEQIEKYLQSKDNSESMINDLKKNVKVKQE